MVIPWSFLSISLSLSYLTMINSFESVPWCCDRLPSCSCQCCQAPVFSALLTCKEQIPPTLWCPQTVLLYLNQPTSSSSCLSQVFNAAHFLTSQSLLLEELQFSNSCSVCFIGSLFNTSSRKIKVYCILPIHCLPNTALLGLMKGKMTSI